MSLANPGESPRPIHFMVTFWGERYREYFADLFLPTMLAPRNLPLLSAGNGHRFFLATTKDDWEAIRALPIMKRVARHATPVWVEVNDPPSASMSGDAQSRYVGVLHHMKECIRTLFEAGYDSSCYGSFFFPDHIVSDGMVAALLKHIRAGHRLLLCPVLRQSQEGVLSELHSLRVAV